MERSIVVRGANANTVAVFRGMERETYSCTPLCERRITLGDSAAYFTATLGQTDIRNGQSSGAGSKGNVRCAVRAGARDQPASLFSIVVSEA